MNDGDSLKDNSLPSQSNSRMVATGQEMVKEKVIQGQGKVTF